VAVFRRGLHGYADFRPSVYTCDQLARWLVWSGFTTEDIVAAAGMTMRYLPGERRVTVALDVAEKIEPYHAHVVGQVCDPAHVPSGPRRKWRSDACRMWPSAGLSATPSGSPPVQAGSHSFPPPSDCPFYHDNERLVPCVLTPSAHQNTGAGAVDHPRSPTP